MPSFLPIGLGAGLAAAVLFASAVLGQSVLGLLLLLIVPLPKFLAGLGWGWPAALTAAVSATVLVAIVAWVGKVFVLAIAVTVVESTNAKLRLFRVPELVSISLGLGFLALAIRFL